MVKQILCDHICCHLSSTLNLTIKKSHCKSGIFNYDQNLICKCCMLVKVLSSLTASSNWQWQTSCRLANIKKHCSSSTCQISQDSHGLAADQLQLKLLIYTSVGTLLGFDSDIAYISIH